MHLAIAGLLPLERAHDVGGGSGAERMESPAPAPFISLRDHVAALRRVHVAVAPMPTPFGNYPLDAPMNL